MGSGANNLSPKDFPQIIRSEHDDDLNAKRVFSIADLVPYAKDYIKVTYPNTTTEVYTFKNGGASGTTVATITVVFTDSSKENLDTVTVS